MRALGAPGLMVVGGFGRLPSGELPAGLRGTVYWHPIMKLAIHLRQLFFRFSWLRLFPASLKREELYPKRSSLSRFHLPLRSPASLLILAEATASSAFSALLAIASAAC
jgi:hypothetical protein